MIFKLIFLVFGPGLPISVAKRFGYNVQPLIIRRIKNPDLKYWTETYFRITDNTVTKVEEMCGKQTKLPPPPPPY